MLTLAGELEADLKDAIDATSLPKDPDYDAVNVWLIRAYRNGWSMLQDT